VVEVPEVEVTLPEVEIPEVRLPDVEISEVQLPEVEATFASLKVPEIQTPPVELTRPEEILPEVEVWAEFEGEPPSAAVVTPPEDTEVASLRDEIASLRALLAQLESQAGQAAAAAQSAEPPATEPGAGASRLPGADEIARIAAEMAAITPKRSADAPPDLSEPAQPPRPGQKRAAATGDNLEIIMGVGPIYAKRLREAGITTYRQLAEASYEVLDKVSRGNLERVIKEDWRGQAQRLMSR